MAWIFDSARGLREEHGEPKYLPVGTLFRHGNRGLWSRLIIVPHASTRTRKWVTVPSEHLPARLRTEMLLLGVAWVSPTSGSQRPRR